MGKDRTGQIAVIFTSRRTAMDAAGYDEAAARMEALAKQQPGYCGIDSARDTDGFGITVSYWRDEAAAIAWRAHAEQSVSRQAGRERWYASYDVVVAGIARSYAWHKP